MTDVPEWSRLAMTTNTLAARLKKALDLKATQDLAESFYPGNFHGGTGALVAGMEFMEMITSNLIPPGEAYMLRLPDPFRMNFEPLQFSEPEDYSQIKFKVMQDYSVKLGVPRSLILTCDVGGFDEPRVVWPEPKAPAQPLSGWQWLVIVGVLSWILCALSRAI